MKRKLHQRSAGNINILTNMEEQIGASLSDFKRFLCRVEARSANSVQDCVHHRLFGRLFLPFEEGSGCGDGALMLT